MYTKNYMYYIVSPNLINKRHVTYVVHKWA